MTFYSVLAEEPGIAQGKKKYKAYFSKQKYILFSNYTNEF